MHLKGLSFVSLELLVWVNGGRQYKEHLRERSCLLRCSLLLNARLQNWHLYFFSGAEVFFAGELDAGAALGAISIAENTSYRVNCRWNCKE